MWTCPKCSWSNRDEVESCSCGYQFISPDPRSSSGAQSSPPRWWDKISFELPLGCGGSLFLMVLFLVLSGFLADYYRPLSLLCLLLTFSFLISAIKFFVEMETSMKLKSLGTGFGVAAVLLLILPIVLLTRRGLSGEALANFALSIVFALIGAALWWGGLRMSRIKPRE
jgi:hypothetical protein